MKANLLKLAMLSVSLLAFATANGQNNLSDEAVKVIKELKAVDTKKLSADEAQTVMKVLNLIKRENTPSAQFTAPVFHQRGEGCTTKCPREELKVVATTVSAAEKPLFILNGKEISEAEFRGLNPNCVADLKLIKGEEAVSKYGEKAANGVLAITTKQCPRAELKVASTPVAEKPLFILNGKEISEAEFRGLNPNCVADLKLIKGEEAVSKYGEKAANGVLFITSKKDNAEKVQVTGFTTVIRGKGDVTTEPIANVDLAVKAVNQGNVLVILDGIEISEEKFKSLDPNSIEKLELRKGETMKVLYGEKAANGVLFITSVKAAAENEQRAARRANAQNVHVVTRADLKPVESATKVKAISIFEPMMKSGSENEQRAARRANAKNVHVVTKADLKPISSSKAVELLEVIAPTFHVRGSMAGIENINSDELPVISKFKQNGNQVSFRIEVPKTENAKKQKININYTLPTM